MKCADCRFCQRGDYYHRSMCRANPPGPNGWPYVDLHKDWCGKFEAHPPKSTTPTEPGHER